MFILIIIYAITLRIIPILHGRFPFQYDNAKDSLIMLQMFRDHDPSLVGPITSIDGFFNGPAWYYLGLPLNILGKFDPFMSILTIVIFGAFSTWFAFKTFGKITSVVYATSVGIIASQQTAWSPYMTAFLTLPILWIVEKINPGKVVQTKYLVFLTICTLLLFHTQIAFGVIFLPLIIVAVLRKKPTISARQILIVCMVGLIFLSPWILFELEHNFSQTKAVASFARTFNNASKAISSNKQGFNRVTEIGFAIISSGVKSTTPYHSSVLAIYVFISIFFYLISNQSLRKNTTALFFLFGTFIGYLYLPFKPYYLVGLTPIWIVLFSRSIQRFSKSIRYILVFFIIITSCFQLWQAIQNSIVVEQNTSIFFKPKLAAIEQAYRYANGKRFASYHYVPEVYDYTYQHIYLMLALQGKTLPIKFSYDPEEVAYMPWKPQLHNSEIPEITILIVENDTNQALFQRWWEKRTKNMVIVESKKINEMITVYALK